MWTAIISREQLIQLLAGSTSVRLPQTVSTGDSISEPQSDDLLIAWAADPKANDLPPSVIVTRDDKAADFLAWASTYFAGFRPITAYFRVLEFSVFRKIQDAKTVPSLGAIQAACAGGVLGEAFVSELKHTSFEEISSRTCAGTFLFAATRAISYGLEDQIAVLYERWLSAKRLVMQPSKPSATDVLMIGQILASLASGRRRIGGGSFDAVIVTNLLECCFELQKEQWISRRTLGRLLRSGGEILHVLDSMKDTREERVTTLEGIIATGVIQREHPAVAAFAYGYLTSLVGPGSLSHSELLAEVIHDLPDALIWYGICAGLYGSSEVLSFSKGLGRRIVRDVMASDTLVSSPRADIGFDELNLLLTGEKLLADFRRGSPSFVVIEIFPLISSSFVWRAKADPSQLTFFDSPQPSSRELIHDLERAAARLLDVLHRLGIEKEMKPRSWKKKKP